MKPGESSLLGKLKFLAGLFWLATTAAGFAGGEEKMWLGGADPLFERDDYYDNGYALRTITPIKDLPKRIVFKPGEVSLVADPTDHRGKYMVVWLINDKDEPVKGVVGEMFNVRSEVRLGGRWFDREELTMGCATFEASEDLPARHALALGGLRNDFGDTEGMIRYNLAGSEPKSAPMSGKYSASSLFRTHRLDGDMDGPISSAIVHGLGMDDWTKNGVVSGPEEFCAVLELARCEDQFLSEKAALLNWLTEPAAKRNLKPETRQVVESIKSTLAKPWIAAGDTQALADRAISALEARDARSFGSPEKHPDVIWRYLSSGGGIGHLRAALRVTDGARSADVHSRKRLVALAIRDLKGGNANTSNAAAGFLADPRWASGLVPSEVYLEMLQSSDTVTNSAGLHGLVGLKMNDEAGPWVLAKVESGHPRSMDFYQTIRSRKFGPMMDWEKKLIRYLLEHRPLVALSLLSRDRKGDPNSEIPEECHDMLRAFLHGELKESRVMWWEEFSMKPWNEKSIDEQWFVKGMSYAVRILDSWDDPQDNDLLRAFLEHPAASLSSYGLEYEARSSALAALKRRNHPIPENPITRAELKGLQNK